MPQNVEWTGTCEDEWRHRGRWDVEHHLGMCFGGKHSFSMEGREERLSPATIRGVRHWFRGDVCSSCVDARISQLEKAVMGKPGTRVKKGLLPKETRQIVEYVERRTGVRGTLKRWGRKHPIFSFLGTEIPIPTQGCRREAIARQVARLVDGDSLRMGE